MVKLLASNVKWLIQDFHAEDIEQLTTGLKANGNEFKIVDTSHPFEWDWELFGEKDCVVSYGSIQFGRFLQKNAKWLPGHYMTTENYACTKFYDIFRELLLNYERHMYLPFAELTPKKEFIYEVMGQDETVFIRPNSGDKLFTGRSVYQRDYAHRIFEFEMYGALPDSMCLIAPPRNIVKEWRFFIVDNEIICGSLYLPDQRCIDMSRDDDTAAYSKAAEVLARCDGWEPDRAWCLDVCETKGGDYYALEIGSFSSAGLYLADMTTMVAAVNKVALEEWSELYGE